MPSPTLARSPNGCTAGTKMLTSSTASDVPAERVYCCDTCRAATCPTSWPSTPASSASSPMCASSPRVT